MSAVNKNFRWLYRYLFEFMTVRKILDLPTTGIECELRRMQAAIRKGKTCHVSYRCGNMFWRWSVKHNDFCFPSSIYITRSWDPVTREGTRFDPNRRRIMDAKRRQMKKIKAQVDAAKIAVEAMNKHVFNLTKVKF